MVVRKPGRESRRELWLWRATSGAALAACAALLLQTTHAPARTAEDERTLASELVQPRSRQRAEQAALVDRSRVRALLANLERARSLSARCMAIDRLARVPELDAEAVAQIARFIEPEHTLELRRCTGYALGNVVHEAAITPLRTLAQCENAQLVETGLVALAMRTDRASQRLAIELSAHAARGLRVAVACALAESGAVEAVALIAGLLEDGAGRDRERLLMSLGRSGDPRAIGVLQGFLAKGNRSAQQAAIYALGEIGGSAATETLLSVLRERPELAQLAAGALARTGSDEAREALLALAEQNSSYGAGLSALQALSDLDGPGVSELMQRALGEGGQQAQSIAIEYFVNHREHDVFDTLEQFAHAGTMQTSTQAIQALSRIGGERALDVVEEIAQAGGPLAPMALQMLNADQADPTRARRIALTQAELGNPGALEILVGDDSPEARAALTKLALSGDSAVSGRALWSLAQRNDPESRKLTEKLASGSDPQKRASAMWALAQSNDPAAIGILRKGLSDSDDNVRREAVQALGQLPGLESEAALLGATRDKSVEVVAAAANQLAQLGTPAAITRLEEIARAPATAGQGLSALVGSAPTRAAPIAEALIASGDVEARRAALMVASSLPGDAGARVMVAALKNSDPEFVREALETVAGSFPSDEVRAAVRALSDSALPDDLKARAAQVAGSAAGGYAMHEARAQHMIY